MPKLLFTQAPVQVEAKLTESRSAIYCEGTLLLGSRIVSYDPSSAKQKLTNLTGEFSAAGSPDVSFDGKRFLFVGIRSSDDSPHVWEMNIDGSGLKQITKEIGSCCRAIYLSTIYTIEASKPVYQIAFCSDANGQAEHSLYTCRMDGTRIRRITFNPYGSADPYLLSDGRLLYSSGQLSESTRDQAFFTVNTDGTGVFPFAANHESVAQRGMPCEIPDGRIVYVESLPGGSRWGSALISVSRTASLHTRRVIASDPSGLYRSPSPIGNSDLLVSYRSQDSDSWGIYKLNPESGDRIDRIYDADQWHELDAVVVQPRSEPAGRSSMVDERVDNGFLYCMNAYLSDTIQGQRISDGQIDKLQVFSAITNGSRAIKNLSGEEEGESLSGVVAEELLGIIPIESDGSFYLKIPARTPLRLQTLDAEGQVLQAMRNWIWVMPKEARGCIGCHEDRELSPPNRHTLALRKAPYPVGVEDSQLGWSSSASAVTNGRKE